MSNHLRFQCEPFGDLDMIFSLIDTLPLVGYKSFLKGSGGQDMTENSGRKFLEGYCLQKRHIDKT